MAQSPSFEKDMPAELADSTTGKEWLKASLGIFRAITAVATAVITVTMLMALEALKLMSKDGVLPPVFNAIQ